VKSSSIMCGLCLCAWMSACGSSATQTPVVLPSGEQGSSIQCTESGGCYEAAGKACPTGYQIIDQSSKTTMEVPAVAQFAYGSCKGQKQQNPKANCDDTQPQPIPVERTTMLIRCKSLNEPSDNNVADHSSASSTVSTPSSQVEPAPVADGSVCGTWGSGGERMLYMSVTTQNDCSLPDNDKKPSNQLPFTRNEGEKFTLGELKCSMGKRKQTDERCVILWSCETPEKKQVVFGLKVNKGGVGNLNVMKQVSETQICETVYAVSPNE
jgi:hypothetical protein